MIERNRFDRRGNVVREARTFIPEFGTSNYEPQTKSSPIDPSRLFVAAKSSPARSAFKAARVARRLAERTSNVRAMQAVHKAAAK